MTSLSRLFASAALVTAAALAAGCDPGPAVHLQIRFGGDERKSVFRNPGSPTTRGSDVDTLTLEAYNPGTGQSKSVQMPNNFTVEDQTQAGGLEVKAGDGWRVLLTGTDRDGHLYGMGRTATFTIPAKGEVNPTLVFGIADDFAATAKVPGGLGPFGSANVLPDGSVLLLGPGGAWLHDPVTGGLCDDCLTNRPPPRQLHVAVSLPGGKVFIAGGISPSGTPLQDAFLFDAGAKSFSVVPSTGFPGRAGTAAAALQNGQVLMAGGRGAQPGDASRVLVVDPTTGNATPAPNLAGPATLASATVLDDGQVLVAGGLDPAGVPLSAAAVYSQDGSTATAVAPLLTARGAHSATKLSDGHVLIYGGGGVSGIPARFTAIAAPEAYAAQASTFIRVSTTATLEPRAGHTGVLLDSGDLLLIGGNPDAAGPPDPGRLVPAVRFTPEGEVGGNFAGTFDTTGQVVARTGACAVALPDLSVLVAGGAWPAFGADPLAPATASDWVEGVDLFVPCRIKDHGCPR
ncbi:MAG TPA: kelch repeat-containing protein [Myxococcaceae bacterium]|nr:kelch repeat-containing protein [Myxococcaceae bacterium]